MSFQIQSPPYWRGWCHSEERLANLTPSLWALWNTRWRAQREWDYRTDHWRPLKGDCFPRNTSTLRLKLALTLSPSVDSNARHLAVSSAAERNAVSCRSLIDPRYSWHESAWNGAHRWNSSADRSTHAGGRIRLIVIGVPDSLPAGWLIWSTCTGSLAMKYLGQPEKDGAQLETWKRGKKEPKMFFPRSITLPSS